MRFIAAACVESYKQFFYSLTFTASHRIITIPIGDASVAADASAAITLAVGDGRGINGRLAIAMMG